MDNALGALRGDRVEPGLAMDTQIKGLFIAFILPVIALFVFSYAGHGLSLYAGIKNLDVTAGMTGLICSIFCSCLLINKLGNAAQLRIIKILQGQTEYGVGSCFEDIDYFRAFDRSKQLNHGPLIKHD